jgi:predicted nucleotidyltransferase
MKRDDVLAILRAEQPRLRSEFGVKSLTLFGSVARDEATPASDVDLLVEFDRPTGYFGLVRLQFHLQEILGCTVDVGTQDSLRPTMRTRVEREAIRVA